MVIERNEKGIAMPVPISISIGDLNPHPYYRDKKDSSSPFRKEKSLLHPLSILTEKKNLLFISTEKNLPSIPIPIRKNLLPIAVNIENLSVNLFVIKLPAL